MLAPDAVRIRQQVVVGAVSLCVSVGLVYWLVSRIDTARTLKLLSQADWSWLVLATLFTVALPLTNVLRWLGILRAQRIQIPFGLALRAIMMTNVLNSFLPSRAGDVAKAAYLREHGGLAKGTGTVILERLVDFAVLGVLGLLGLFANGTRWELVAGSALVGGVLISFLGVLLFPLHKLPLPRRLARILQDLRMVFANWLRDPAAITQTLLGSLLTRSLGGVTVYALAHAFGTDLSLGFAFAILPLAVLAGLVPVTVSGIGTRDAAFVALLSSRMSTEQATLVGLGYTFFSYWLLSLLSFPAVAWQVLAYVRASSARRAKMKLEAQ